MNIHWKVQCPCKRGPLKGWITVGGKTEVMCANCARTITINVTENVADRTEQLRDADEEYLRKLIPEGAINIQRLEDHENNRQVEMWFTVRHTEGDPDSGVDYFLMREVTPQEDDPGAEWVWVGLGDVGLLEDPIRITEDPSGTPEPRLTDVRAFIAEAIRPR